jgi:protein SCO1/2
MRNFVVQAVSLGLLGLGAAPAAAHSLDELEAALRGREPSIEIVHQPAPHFALENPAGRGKVVLLYSMQSRKLSEIQRELNKTPMSDRVQFIMILHINALANDVH